MRIGCHAVTTPGDPGCDGCSFRGGRHAGTFTATGSLPPALGFHTATLLPDGNVLITGGVDANLEQVINAAWLYNPKTGTFSATGSMATPRHQHTATLLSDGRVLIVGGAPSGASDITTVDKFVYNPKSGTFSPTGSMTTPRGLQTMTLLPDGRVLVVGGCYNGSGQASADLYNPKTGKFSPTGSMATPRCYQTATLLPDGRVLIAGGFSNVSGLSLASAELYNPKTGTFSPTGSMTAARAAQTATLLPDGNVLITGGDAWGFMGGNNLASAEIYDPKTGTFSPTGP